MSPSRCGCGGGSRGVSGGLGGRGLGALKREMDRPDACVQQLVDQMQAKIAAGDLESARRGWELVRDNDALRFANKNAVLNVCCEALGLDVVHERRLCAEALRRNIAERSQAPVLWTRRMQQKRACLMALLWN